MSKYWTGKRVCVTGGAGFVGSQLVRELLYAGADVTVIDNFSRGHNTLGSVKYVDADVRNKSSLEYAFRGMLSFVGPENSAPVDVVFNLAAAVAGVLHNMEHHHDMFLQNANLQVVPLAVAQTIRVPTFVQVSSVCVYDPKYNHPSFEDDGLLGTPHAANAGYAWGKRVGEYAVQWSDHPRAIIVRPSNIFGPYDYFDERAHVIPATIRKVLHDDKVEMYGPASVVREFIFSRDVALGMMAAAEFGRNKEAYNLGCHGQNKVTMRELLKLIFEITGERKEVIWHENVGGGDPFRWSDSKKAHKELRWQYKTRIQDGLRETVEWYSSINQ